MGFIRLTATVLDSPDPLRLARFYADLLDWELGADGPNWATVRDPQSRAAGLSFQREPLFRPPAWPAERGRQSMQMHLDIEVEDLGAAVRRAQDLGAELEAHQPQQDVRVMRDPDGHLFCLWIDRDMSA